MESQMRRKGSQHILLTNIHNPIAQRIRIRRKHTTFNLNAHNRMDSHARDAS
jgi:hypothetical protein